MNAGELDRRITFEAKTGTQNSGTGAWSYTWRKIDQTPEVWAKVIEETRPEKVEAGIDMASRPCVIFIRYRNDITADMRVIYGERTMKIVAGPAEVGRREWLKFSAVDYSTQGNDF